MLGSFFRFFGLRKNCWKNASKKHRKKCENQGSWPPKTVSKPSQNPSKIDVPKNMQFFIDFCSNFDACCKSQHQKNVRPRSVLLAFHTIRLFACGMHFWSKKPTKNPPKTRSEAFRNRCRKRVVFQHRFFRLSDSILEPLGPPTWSQVGRLELPAPFQKPPKSNLLGRCAQDAAQEGARWLPRSPRRRFFDDF